MLAEWKMGIAEHCMPGSCVDPGQTFLFRSTLYPQFPRYMIVLTTSVCGLVERRSSYPIKDLIHIIGLSQGIK
jgi:hypothetical protein